MRRSLIWLVIGLQLAVPAWMALQRELIVQYGERFWLRTAPVDPRDIFRGDYVRLDYGFSQIPPRQAAEDLQARGVRRGDLLYLTLEPAPGGLARAASLTAQVPAAGPFLRGRALLEWRARPGAGALGVRYGIEKYFVEQGRGLEMEQRRGTRDGVQVPLEMEVAVGGGVPVITGHRWSDLGVRLEVLRAGSQGFGRPTVSARVELSLHNASDGPLALVLLPDQCSFALRTVSTAPRELRAPRPECAARVPAAEDLVVLAPGQSSGTAFDLDEARWHLEIDGVATPAGELDWSERLRLVYRTPDAAALAGLAAPAPVWQGELLSPAFSGGGQVD